MSNYTQSTNFATKDALSPGDPLKIVRGTEINTEFTNIAVAVATKFDTTGLASPGPIGATTPAAINGTTGTFSGNVQMASANGSCLAGLRNRLINGGFGVNQRAVSGTVTLTAGAYGHDRWKGGASGCTYTFATSANVTTLTISAGSLIQVIEGINLETGTYCLSFSGTATAKIGAGSLSASGVTGSITGGTNTNIEISTGTVSKVQLENSPISTIFEQRPIGMELALCQRYYYRLTPGAVNKTLSNAPCIITSAFSGAGSTQFPVSMRTTPITLDQSGIFNQYCISSASVVVTCTSIPILNANLTSEYFGGATFTSAGLTTGVGTNRTDTTNGATAFLGWSAEL